MYKNPKISITCVTYNRRKLLENMIDSFILTNKYENFELIILEHDSTDGTKEYLKEILKFEDDFYDPIKGKFKVLFESENDYLEFLKKRNIDVSNSKKSALACFPMWRNMLNEELTGEIWVDIPDDFQFIYSGDYLSELVSVFNDRISKVGENDISCLTFRTKFYYRIMKKNNTKGPIQITQEGVEYYMIDTEKAHDEWCAFPVENIRKIGLFPLLENASEEVLKKWNEVESPNYYYFHHLQIKKTFYENGYRRADLKIPFVHDCLDRKYENIMKEKSPVFNIFNNKIEFKEQARCKDLSRQLSIEEFEHYVKTKQLEN